MNVNRKGWVEVEDFYKICKDDCLLGIRRSNSFNFGFGLGIVWG